MNQVNNKLIAKNTIILYFRMLITLGIALFTTRELLRILGTEDFGLYNVIGGIVLMMGFLNNAMIASSQRFISFSLGEGNTKKQKEVFSSSILIHLTIALIILVLSETVGLWFVNNKMTIPENRICAVKWVYQASIASFICNIMQVPFSATVIAHEKMTFYAIVSIIDSIFKLTIVYILTLINFDQLKLYAIFTFGISFLNFILYIFYTKIKFNECQFSWNIERSLYSQMLKFAGWSFVGNFGFAAKDYGVNIILNIFCGPIVNASRGIAYQVMNAVNAFVANIQTAMNPQITKRYAIGEIDSMIQLVKNSSRYSFYLLSIIIVPLYVRAEYVLNLWLDEPPNMTLQFLRLTLIMSLINSMHGSLVTAMQATGKIKVFQITIASIMILDLPIAYTLLKIGCSPYSVMYSAIFTAFIGLIARVILLNKLIYINIRNFLIDIVIKNIFLFVIMFLPIWLLSLYIPQTFVGFVILTLVSIIYSLAVIYCSCYKNEKLLIKNIINKAKSQLYIK